MKQPRYHLLAAVLLACLAALPARAVTANGIAISQGPGKLVSSLITAGYGSVDLYETLVLIQRETNPSLAGVITPAFIETLASCPLNSTIFTTLLSSYPNGVVIYEDCTVQPFSPTASGYNGLPGSTTLSTVITGVSAPAAAISFSTPYPWDSTHSLLGILYAPTGPSQTFILSNEGGQLITNLVNAGYGNVNLYETLVDIQIESNPSLAGVITPSFLATLQDCAAGNQLFTTPLKSFTGTLAISDDCSVVTNSLQGSTFNGQPGTTSLAVNITGVGPATAVSGSPLTSWTQSVTVGSSTATVTYNAFAILYTPATPSGTPAPPSLWLALAGCLALLGYALWSRRRAAVLPLLLLGLAALPAHAQVQSVALTQGPGKLIDSLIAAGYGTDTLYQTLVNLEAESNPGISGVVTPAFILTLKNCGSGTQVHTTPLSTFANLPGTSFGVLVSTDCTVVQTHLVNGSGQNGSPGVSTLAFAISGVTAPAAIVSSATPFYVFAPNGDAGCFGATCHNVFAIVYAPQGPSQTFVLSDEAPGHLIAELVAGGYGNASLYDALVAIQNNTDPGIAGVLTFSFIDSLASCSAAHSIFTTKLSSISGAVAIGDDCSVTATALQGSAFTGQPGTATGVYTISGVGPASAVYSTTSNPLSSWTQAVTVGNTAPTVTYSVFAILYNPQGAPPATPAPPSLWLALAGCLALLGYALRSRCPSPFHRSQLLR
jgi:hypothetical protein